MEHHFETFPGLMVCSQPYQFLDHKVQIVHRELSEMLKLGVIESHSVQCSPIVLVVKTDGGAQTDGLGKYDELNKDRYIEREMG